MLVNLGYGLSPTRAIASQKLSSNSVIALFGDSLETHNGYGSNTAGSEEHSNWSRGYYNWCRILDPRGKFETWYDQIPASRFNGCNKGVSGNTTTQMVARKTDITNITGVKLVIQGGGTNDIN